MQYVKIQNGVVVDAIVCDNESFGASIGYVHALPPVAICWTFDGTNFAAPPAPPAPAPEPLQVTPYQFKAALVQVNLYTQALAAVNAADQLTQLAWNEALTFIENDPIVTKFAAALGQSTAQVHALFQLAGTLNP